MYDELTALKQSVADLAKEVSEIKEMFKRKFDRAEQAEATSKSIVALIKHKIEEIVIHRNHIAKDEENYVAAYRELTLQINLLYGLLKEIGEA